MPSYFDKARKRWRYEFDRLVGGQRLRARKLLPRGWTAEQAEAYGRTQDARLFASAAGTHQADPLISEAVKAYLTEHAPGLKNCAKVESDLALCFEWFKGRHMAELAEVVSTYRADNPDLAPATVRNRMAYLRAACRWAWKVKKMGKHDPAERVVMPTVRNERHVYIDRRQLLQLARRISNLDARAVVLVAYYSGMRKAEIMRAEPTERGWLLTDTKNGERRIVPIHPRTAHLARAWPRAVASSTVSHNLRAAADSLGMTWLRFHDLRHSTASALIAAGVDLYTVGGVLGHKSAQSSKRYAHLATEKLAVAIGAL